MTETKYSHPTIDNYGSNRADGNLLSQRFNEILTSEDTLTLSRGQMETARALLAILEDPTQSRPAIVIRGLSGSGKSTVIDLLAPALKESGIAVLEDSDDPKEYISIHPEANGAVALDQASALKDHADNAIKPVIIIHKGFTDDEMAEELTKLAPFTPLDPILKLSCGSLELAKQLIQADTADTIEGRRIACAIAGSFFLKNIKGIVFGLMGNWAETIERFSQAVKPYLSDTSRSSASIELLTSITFSAAERDEGALGVARLESGNINPSLEFLQKVAQVMGLSVHLSR